MLFLIRQTVLQFCLLVWATNATSLWRTMPGHPFFSHQRELRATRKTNCKRGECFSWAKHRLHNPWLGVYTNTLEFLLLKVQREGRGNSLNIKRASCLFFFAVIHSLMLTSVLLLKQPSTTPCVSVVPVLCVIRETRDICNLSVFMQNCEKL